MPTTSVEPIKNLMTSDKASEGFGVFQLKIRFIGSVFANRYILTDAFSGLVTTPEHWKGFATSSLL